MSLAVDKSINYHLWLSSAVHNTAGLPESEPATLLRRPQATIVVLSTVSYMVFQYLGIQVVVTK